MKVTVNSFLSVCMFAVIFSIGSGCQLAPVLTLWNGSSSEVQVECPDQKLVLIKPNSKRKLPSGGVVAFGEKYDFVIRKDGKRLCYKIDFVTLRNLKESRFHRIDFQVSEKNEVKILRIDSLKFDSSTNQPYGFPLIPFLERELN